MQPSCTVGADAGRCAGKSACTVVHGAARCRRCLSHLGDGARLQSCTVGGATVHLAPCVPWQPAPSHRMSHVACRMSHSSKTRRPARRKGPLSVWSDPGAGQASFFCQRGPHWSERLFGIGTDRGQWRHQISFILPAPRDGPARKDLRKSAIYWINT